MESAASCKCVHCRSSVPSVFGFKKDCVSSPIYKFGWAIPTGTLSERIRFEELQLLSKYPLCKLYVSRLPVDALPAQKPVMNKVLWNF